MVSCYALQHPSMAEAAAAQEPCSAASCFVLWGPTAPQPHEMGNSPLAMCGREDLSARCLGQRWQEKIWYHVRFRDLTLPQRSTKPARELIFLRKPSHFCPAIWSVKQGMGNGWVIPKGHQPSSQTYFSNALHFNVHVGIPAKRLFLVAVLLFLELGKGALSDAGDALVFHRLIGNVKYLEKMQQMQGQDKIFRAMKISPNLRKMPVNNSIVYYYQL